MLASITRSRRMGRDLRQAIPKYWGPGFILSTRFIFGIAVRLSSTFIRVALLTILASIVACSSPSNTPEQGPTPAEIFGNPDYRAISYGGYRGKTRQEGPTVEQLTDDAHQLQMIFPEEQLIHLHPPLASEREVAMD